ncbi:hypothetical protein [Salinisphaera sp. T31B1]|uniref:RIFT barrel domain-containing protein n=1 Tax=Salinisphaera sp. T31B1 TaxID=727963 RepID=UPI003342132A
MMKWLDLKRMCVVLVLSAVVAGCGGGGGGGSSSNGSGQTASAAPSDSIENGDDSAEPDPSDDGVTGPDVPAPVPVQVGESITTVSLNSMASMKARRAASPTSATFGQIFAEGDVPEGHTVVALSDGERVPMQVDVKARWADGSLRHAVMTVAVDGASRLTLHAAKSESENVSARSSSVTLSDLLGTAFDARLTIRMGGKSYQASARDALSNIAQTGVCPAWGTRDCRQWLQGPLVSEWIVPAALSAGSRSAAGLQVYFHVRAYGDGNGTIENVRVDTVIENALAYAADPANRRYEATIEVGDSKYSTDGIVHYRQARWHRVLWTNGAPALFVTQNMEYLQSSHAISNYANLTPSESLLNGVRQQVSPMSHGDQTQTMGNTGAQPAIGPLPRWTSTYVVSGDRRAYNWMLANDDAASSYSIHYRDEATGRPLKITDHPYVTIAGYRHASSASNADYRRDLLPACTSDCDSKLSFDIAHHPSIGYVAYLVSGDYYFLEEMQFVASYVELWGNAKYRDFQNGRLIGAQGQMRGQAWALRSISDAAFATPDDDPMKAYFVDQINSIVSDYLATYVDDDSSNPLHVIDDYGVVIYPLNGQARVGVGPWQADFFLWAVGHAAEQQVSGARELQHWLAKFQTGRMLGWKDEPKEGFCWLQASAYALQIRASQNAPMFKDMRTVYRQSLPQLRGLKCNGQPMVNAMSTSARNFQVGEMQGYADSPTGFPSNLQIGLAMATDSGIEGGAEAWKVFDTRTVKPNYRDYPNFAVVPRSVR